MEFFPANMEQRDVYRLLDGCIVPRPIAWVSTQDKTGINNLAPFSFFNGIASNPPALSLSITYNRNRITGHKDTLQNILDLGEFVVNFVTAEIAMSMLETSVDYPSDRDEFHIAGLTPLPSVMVRPPRVAESPIHLECVLYDTLQVGKGPGSSVLVVGIVKYAHVHDEILTAQGGIDLQKFRPVGRVSGNGYCLIQEPFELAYNKR